MQQTDISRNSYILLLYCLVMGHLGLKHITVSGFNNFIVNILFGLNYCNSIVKHKMGNVK